MSFQEAVHKLGQKTAGEVLKLWAQVPEGVLSLDEFVQAAAVAVLNGNARGVALAELSLNALLEFAGYPSVSGLDVEDVTHWLEEDRVRAALTTSVAVQATAATRLERLARSEPVEAAQRAFGEAMTRSSDVEGWERDLEGDACELCRWWWREGRVWPKDHTMPTHKGCECTQRPVLVQRVQAVSKSARNESADRAAYGTAAERRLVDPAQYSRRSKKES